MEFSEDEIRCPVCKDQSSCEYFSTIKGYPHLKCRSCLVVFRKDIATGDLRPPVFGDAAFVRRYYQDRETKQFLAARSMSAIEPFHVSRLGKPKLLDYGCAAGFLLEAAEAVHYECWGIEPDPAFRSLCRTTCPHSRISASLEEADFPDSFFDAIVMSNVLSHLAKPREAFEQIHRILKPSGIALVITGNKGELESELAGSILSDRWEPVEHFVHLSEMGLRKLCSTTGLTVLDVKREAKLDLILSPLKLKGVSSTGWKGLFLRQLLLHDNLNMLVHKWVDLRLGRQQRSCELTMIAKKPGV